MRGVHKSRIVEIGTYTMVRVADNDFRMLCRKCRGTGTVDYHMDVDEGLCYDCDGRGHWKTKYTQTGALREQERAKAKAEQARIEWEAGEAERVENARLAAIKHEEEAARRAEALIAEQALSRCLDGEVGEFVEVVATKVADKWFDTQWGGNAFNLFMLEELVDGETLTFKIVSFTTSALWEVHKGEKVRIRVKIKAFEVHEGFWQTVVTHGKVLEVFAQEEVAA
jgi:hypothetical protein